MLPELDEGTAHSRIAARVAQELRSGDVVNLGIGIPTLVPTYLPKDKEVILQAENGALCVGPPPAEPDLTRIGAGGRYISLLPGGCFFSSDMSFGLIRGGHVDVAVLGALEVDEEGNLANWAIPGRALPGMGGAMDLVVGVKRVIVASTHLTKEGTPKIRKRCSLPPTATAVVRMIVTEFAVFQWEDGFLTLTEISPDVTLEQIRLHTEADYRISLRQDR